MKHLILSRYSTLKLTKLTKVIKVPLKNYDVIINYFLLSMILTMLLWVICEDFHVNIISLSLYIRNKVLAVLLEALYFHTLVFE